MFPMIPFLDVLYEMDTKKKRSKLANQMFFIKHGTIDQVFELVKRNGLLYKECAPEHKKSTTLFKLALRHRCRDRIFRLAPPEIRNNNKLVESVVLKYPSLYRYAPLEHRKNKSFTIRVLKASDVHNQMQLKSVFCSCYKKLQRDPSVLRVYLRKACPEHVTRIAPTVLDNLELLKIVLEKTRVCGRTIDSILPSIPAHFFDDRDSAISLIDANPNVFSAMPPSVQSDPDIFNAACDGGFNALKFVPHFPNRDAVLRFSGCLESAPELQGDRALVLEAIAKNPSGYRFAHPSLMKDKVVAAAALEAGIDPSVIDAELWEDEPFLMANFKMFYECPMMAWQRIPQRLKSKKTIILRFAATKPYVLNVLPVEMFDASDWIKVVSVHKVTDIKFMLKNKIEIAAILRRIVPPLKRAHGDVTAVNTLVFSTTSLPSTLLRIVAEFLVPPNYGEMRDAIKHLENYWKVPFSLLPYTQIPFRLVETPGQTA